MHGWVNRVECYFEMKGILDKEKLQSMMVAMESQVLFLVIGISLGVTVEDIIEFHQRYVQTAECQVGG